MASIYVKKPLPWMMVEMKISSPQQRSHGPTSGSSPKRVSNKRSNKVVSPRSTPCASSTSANSGCRSTRSSPHPRDGVGRAERELSVLAFELVEMCERYGLAHPAKNLPAREQLRQYDPTLANRIEALRGRNGYRRLAVYVGAPTPPRTKRRRRNPSRLAPWKRLEYIKQTLRPFQRNLNVLPPLLTLDHEIRTAIRWHGGAYKFCEMTGMLRDGEWRTMRRFACFLRRIVRLVHDKPLPSFFERVDAETNQRVFFPSTDRIRASGLWTGLQRYGGRRALIVRLGFASPRSGLFMGPFSVSFAAELVTYAISVVAVSQDLYLGMPSIERMKHDGRLDLIELCDRFGGHVEVARRVGLVPGTVNVVFPDRRDAVLGDHNNRSTTGM